MDNEEGSGDFIRPPSFSQSEGGGSSLKGTLKGWREILVVGAKLLKWEQPYYAAIVFGIISVFFLTIWWLDPSVITGFSMLIMIFCLADYIVPLAMPMIFPETSWSNKKEEQYSAACSGLTNIKKTIGASYGATRKLKEQNPWLYIAAITVSLSTLAWLGNQMHNLLLSYLFVLLFAALPGLSAHGLLDKAMAHINKLLKKRKTQ